MKPTVDDFLIATSRVSGIPLEELTSTSRAAGVVLWRQRGIYLARRLTMQPLKVIADTFNRNITTCFTSCQAVEANLLADKVTKLALARLVMEAQNIAVARTASQGQAA